MICLNCCYAMVRRGRYSTSIIGCIRLRDGKRCKPRAYAVPVLYNIPI